MKKNYDDKKVKWYRKSFKSTKSPFEKAVVRVLWLVYAKISSVTYALTLNALRTHPKDTTVLHKKFK